MPTELAMTDEDATTDEETESADDHLAELEDGAGCTEIWEHLSRNRDGPGNAASDDD